MPLKSLDDLRLANVPQDPHEGLHGDGLTPIFTMWSLQPDGYFCLSIRPLQPDAFHDIWFQKQGPHFRQITGYPKFTGRYDTYFCPSGFAKPRRLKAHTLPSRILFADLDYVPPHEVPVAPTFSWETSRGKWQAIWVMDHPLEPDVFRHLNRAMNHACDADPGTWNVNRLLRAPNSDHVKHLRKGR